MNTKSIYRSLLPMLTGPKHFEYKLTRSKLEDLVKDLVDGVAGPDEKALKDAGLTAKDIDEVCAGWWYDPYASSGWKVKSNLWQRPTRRVNPDEVVAISAAIQGGVLQGDVKTYCYST